MDVELWGAFSVRDHLMQRAFVADVLLYDKLLIPTCPTPEEASDWPAAWGLDRQRAVIDVLGDLALPIPWNTEHRAKWQTAFDAESEKGRRESHRKILEDVAFDLGNVRAAVDQYKTTRIVLQNMINEASDDGFYVRLKTFAKARPGAKLEAVAAYQDAESFGRDVAVGSVKPGAGTIAPTTIFSWDFFVPESAESGEAADLKLLAAAAKLARTDEFIGLRSSFYGWLADVSEGGVPAAEAQADMERRIASYRRIVERQWPIRIARRVVKVGGAFAGVVGLGHPVLGAGAGAAFGLADVALDEVRTGKPLSLQPAAMFHEARDRLSRFALASMGA